MRGDTPGSGDMTKNFAVGVVAHPQRRDMATKLAEAVGADVTSWDDGAHGDTLTRCAAGHIVVLNQLVGTTAPWVCVLEDDAIPVDDFVFHVKQALEHTPARIVGLYLGTSGLTETQRQIKKAVAAAKDTNRAWILADCLVGSVGYAVESWLLPDIIQFITDRHDEELPLRMSRWAQARQLDIAYTQPSLVDHDDGDSVGRPFRAPGFPKRKAWLYGTRQNWDTPTVKLGHCPIWGAT